MPSCGRNAGGHGFRISLEIRYDRVYEPYALSQDALQFLRSESAKKGWDFNETEEAWRQLAPRAEVYEPWAATMNVKAATQVTTSQLITYLVGGVGWKGAAPCRYDGEFVIDPDPVVARQEQLVLRPP